MQLRPMLPVIDEQKDPAERKLKKVKIALMRNPVFALWSGIMMCGSTKVVDDMPTAATDGYNDYYGRAFIQKLDEKMLGFVVLHENLHKAFRHLSTWQKLFKENPALANQACDYVINLIIVNIDPTGKFVTFPIINGEKFGLLDQRFAGMNTKQVFDILKQEQKHGNGRAPGDQPGGGNGQPGKGGKSFDDHMWEEAADVPTEVTEARIQELDQAIRQGQMMHQRACGKDGTGKMPRELGDLLAPQLDWRLLLREFIQATCATKDTSSWRKVNRRYIMSDIYMPSLSGETMREAVIGVDASGSTFVGKVIDRFLGEGKSIAEDVRPEILHVIYWDTKVTKHETYDLTTLDQMVTETKIVGGGGTNPNCLSEYLKEKRIKADCVVMLTDGLVGGNWGQDWNAPLLWVIAGNPNVTADNGKTCHINDE